MPRCACPSWRWMTGSGTPSRAISTAWACRSWCGANRLRTPAWAASVRSSVRAAVADQPLPRVGPSITHRNGPTGSSRRWRCHGSIVFPSPIVHPDLASLAPLSVPHEDRPAPGLKIGLCERERLVDPQACTPQDHDERSHPRAVGARPRCAHDRDDLLDSRRVRGVAAALVTGRAPRAVPRHGDRRAPPAGSIKQDRHEFLPSSIASHHTTQISIASEITASPGLLDRSRQSTRRYPRAISRTARAPHGRSR
jgi:hypothetical protein